MNNTNINNNISNEALLQLLNYLIVKNMSNNNGMPPLSYLPNYNNYGNGIFLGINNNNNGNNSSDGNINNNNNGNNSNHNTKSILNNEKSGESNNVNSDDTNDNNCSILPSYSEYIQQQPDTNIPFIQPNAPSE